MTVVVSGFRETARAFGKVSRDFGRTVPKALKQAAEPVRAAVPPLAGAALRNLGEGDPWAQMRTGGGVKIVYIAPVKRGKKSGRQKRSGRSDGRGFPDLLMERAMKPALERNREQVASKVDRLLEDVAADWGRGG